MKKNLQNPLMLKLPKFSKIYASFYQISLLNLTKNHIRNFEFKKSNSFL